MTIASITEDLVDRIIVFPYEHRYRLVLVAKVWRSKAGDLLITGLDEDRNDTRTFRVDRIPAQGGRSRIREVK